MRRLLTIILPLLLAGLVACGGSEAPRGPEAGVVATPAATTAAATVAQRTTYPLSVPSSDGRSITIAEEPGRIVSLSAGMTEVLFAIGAGGSVAGVDRFSNYPEAAKALPKVEYSNPNAESLVALRPDLVLASTRQRTLVPALEQAGLPILLLEEPESLAVALERIALLGRIANRNTEAAAVVAGMERRIAAVREKVAGVTAGPRVYHELDPKLFSAAPETFVGDLYTVLKAQNIARGATTRFPQLSAEAIIAADPEVIVLTAAEFPGGSPADVKARSGWGALSAVKNNRIYAVSGDLVDRPGPRIVEGLELLARFLYPDRFP